MFLVRRQLYWLTAESIQIDEVCAIKRAESHSRCMKKLRIYTSEPFVFELTETKCNSGVEAAYCSILFMILL